VGREWGRRCLLQYHGHPSLLHKVHGVMKGSNLTIRDPKQRVDWRDGGGHSRETV
jgi:hypothetical protein